MQLVWEKFSLRLQMLVFRARQALRTRLVQPWLLCVGGAKNHRGASARRRFSFESRPKRRTVTAGGRVRMQFGMHVCVLPFVNRLLPYT